MTKPPIVLGALVVGAFIAGVVYLSRDSGEQTVATTQATSQPQSSAAGSKGSPGSTGSAGPTASASSAQDASASVASAQSGATPATAQARPDPRLDALKVSQDNGLIQFVRAPDGKVIAELDKDPGSPSFRKPLREYLYAGDKVVGLASYRYLPDHVEVSRTVVSYKPDGSVDQFVESMQLN